jgi:hypothetical protein
MVLFTKHVAPKNGGTYPRSPRPSNSDPKFQSQVFDIEIRPQSSMWSFVYFGDRKTLCAQADTWHIECFWKDSRCMHFTRWARLHCQFKNSPPPNSSEGETQQKKPKKTKKKTPWNEWMPVVVQLGCPMFICWNSTLFSMFIFILIIYQINTKYYQSQLGWNNLHIGSLLVRLQPSNKEPMYGLVCHLLSTINHRNGSCV